MIPAGLKEGEVEFFVDGSNFCTMYSGRLMPYDQLPSSIHSIVAKAIDADANSALDSMNLVDWQERHVQFLRCNCARYDFTPDIESGSLLLQREHVKCSVRGNCPVEGKLCKPIFINGHKITPTELKVISHITAGHSDKVICSKLNIAVDTLRTHKRNIQPKLGALTKVQIATQSIKYGIS